MNDSETTNYNAYQNVDTHPCPNCGSPFEFEITSQRLMCRGCGALDTIHHAPDAQVEEQSYDEMLMRSLTEKNLTHSPGENEIICQNCGGQTTFIGSLTASRCPYCATPMQLNDVHEAPDRLSVDGILPFTVDNDAARKALDAWVKSRWFAPNEFKKYSNAGSFSSLYAAYFTFDANAVTDYEGQRGRDRRIKSGNSTRTVTTWSSRSGRVYDSFDDITVLANTGLNPVFVAALEPWPTAKLQPYSDDYLAGHLARTYDHDAAASFQTARTVMDREIVKTIKRDIGGDRQRIDHKQTYLQDVTYKHVLFPIWLLTVLYGGRTWQVFINGDTAEVHGERPYSKVKVAAAVSVVVLLILVFMVLRSLR